MYNFKKITLPFHVLGLLSLIFIIIKTEEIFLIVLYSIYIMLGFLLYREKEEQTFYFISLGISLFFSIFLISSYVAQTGLPFIPGGDAQVYYEKVRAMVNGDFSSYYGRYKLYLFIIWIFYEMVNLFTNSTHFIYFVFCNLFICSNISPLLYKIGKQLFNAQTLFYACLLTAFYPGLIQIASGTLREAFVYAPFIYSIYLAININTRNTILYFITFFLIANIRMEVAVVSIIFFILYNYIFSKKSKSKSIPYILILSVVLIFFYQLGLFEYLNSEKNTSISYQFDAYNEKADNISAEGSITNMLRNAGFIGRVFLFFYAIFAPVPPPVFIVSPMYFHYLFISIGSLIWYFIFPISVLGFINSFKNKVNVVFTKSFLISFIISIFIITLTSVGTARHKLYLYPIIFLYFFQYLTNTSKREKMKIYIPIIIICLMLLEGYLMIKYLFYI